MKKRSLFPAVVVAATVVVLIGGGLWSVAAGEGDGRGQAPIDGAAPTMPLDVGTGQRLHVVVGGAYPTRAQAAAAAQPFGDLQGYYVLPVSQFRGLESRLPVTGRWMLASAFRTIEGAREFARLSRTVGQPAFVTDRLVNVGRVYAGLGQEAAPDGAGPLMHAIPASQPLPGPAKGS